MSRHRYLHRLLGVAAAMLGAVATLAPIAHATRAARGAHTRHARHARHKAHAASAPVTRYAPLDQPGPPLDVPKASLKASLHCHITPVLGQQVVLLVAGTGATPAEQYSWNYEPALAAQGIDWCAETIPDHLLENDETSGEYMVYAIRTLYALTGRRIDIIGHSQGGMIPRWALRFWPDTRAMVDDLISLAGDNHGTAAINTAGICARACVAAAWQQRPGAQFIQALNSGAETFPGVSYTDIYTRDDELSTPNANDNGTTSLHTGGGAITNIDIQSICPADVAEHVLLGSTDPVGFALALDAIRNPGPADPARISSSVCSQIALPGADLTSPFAPGLVTALLWLASAATPLNLEQVPTLPAEPVPACYETASCTGHDAPSLELRLQGAPYAGPHPQQLQLIALTRQGSLLQPAPGVQVRFHGQTKITGADGLITFTARFARPGSWTVRAARTGCNPALMRVRVTRTPTLSGAPRAHSARARAHATRARAHRRRLREGIAPGPRHRYARAWAALAAHA